MEGFDYLKSDDLELVYSVSRVVFEQGHDKKLDEYKRCLQLLTKRLINRGHLTGIPRNIPELIIYLKENSMKHYLEGDVPDRSIIDNYGDLDEFVIAVTSDEKEEEKAQKLMAEIVMNIRKSDYEDKEDVYIRARRFICENYVISSRDLEVRLSKEFKPEIAKKIKEMYQLANDISGTYKLCPICKKPLNFTEAIEGLCCDECNYYREKYNLENIQLNFDTKVKKLHDGIYKYIVKSSIGEMELFNKIRRRFKGYEVKLYPNVDQYDVSISDYETTIALDVKDTKSPSNLVKILLEKSNLEKLISPKNADKVFLVIPDHRVRIYNRENDNNYMRELRTLLKNKGISLEVYQECKLFNTLVSIFEGEN